MTTLRSHQLIDEQYTHAPFYGSRRMASWMEALGLSGQVRLLEASAGASNFINNADDGV